MILQTLIHLYRGQTLLRILMNRALAEHSLRGKVMDVGGGHHPDYFDYFKKEPGAEVEVLDGSFTGIDFERDRLPAGDASVDTVILCNVLEHIYNHAFLTGEVHRVLRPGGRLIGFVPFWVGYHPDPHDYFRYTDEALQRIFADAGFKSATITRVGRGPILANFNTIVLSVPRFIRPVLYLLYAPLDLLFAKLRPGSRLRNPLGYLFVAYV